MLIFTSLPIHYIIVGTELDPLAPEFGFLILAHPICKL